MVQFEFPRVIHPLIPFFFGSIMECPFHWMQEKGTAAYFFLPDGLPDDFFLPDGLPDVVPDDFVDPIKSST